MRTYFYALAVMMIPLAGSAAEKEYSLQSPSGKITTAITCGDKLNYSISYDGKEVLSKSPVSMMLGDGTVWGPDASISKAVRGSNENIVESPFSQSATMPDRYNSLTLRMKGNWSIEFRAYDDGVAYRFASTRKNP